MFLVSYGFRPEPVEGFATIRVEGNDDKDNHHIFPQSKLFLPGLKKYHNTDNGQRFQAYIQM
jgi:hypothetical protein